MPNAHDSQKHDRLQGISEIAQVKGDDSFNKVDLEKFDNESLEPLKTRDSIYTGILQAYSDYTCHTLTKNKIRQNIFFVVSLIIIIASIIGLGVCICISYYLDKFIPLIASVIETVGALIIFPKIVAEYLFSTTETTNVNSIVEAIQNYDISVRSGIRHSAEGRNGTTKD